MFKNRNILFVIVIAVLVVQRILNLNNLLEEPHSWRQGDTFFYAYDFFKNGINLLKPSVCWLGAHKTLIFEFPLVSAFIALFFFIFGAKIIVAKITALIIFIMSAFYFYKIVSYLFYNRLAKFSLLVYLMLPLGLFFSIAVHIDFGAILLMQVFVYYFIKGLKENNFVLLLIGMISGIVAFMVKSPYVFYAYLPLFYFALLHKKNRYFFHSLLMLTVPIIVFYFWQIYVVRINSLSPDWSFIPGYFKLVDMKSWYFGSFDQRLDIENWKILIDRFYESITSYLGLPLFVAGFLLKLKKGYNKNFFYLFSIGLLVYLLLFFSLNVIHNYYQIPLLLMSSFFIAVSLDSIYGKLKDKSIKVANWLISAIIFVLMVNCIWYAQRWYYKVDYVRKEAAEIIFQNTGENDLVISTINITDPRDPRILSQACRQGWSIEISAINSKIIDSLKKYDAGHLAIVTREKLNSSLEYYLTIYNKNVFALRENWNLYLYDLK